MVGNAEQPPKKGTKKKPADQPSPESQVGNAEQPEKKGGGD